MALGERPRSLVELSEDPNACLRFSNVAWLSPARTNRLGRYSFRARDISSASPLTAMSQNAEVPEFSSDLTVATRLSPIPARFMALSNRCPAPIAPSRAPVNPCRVEAREGQEANQPTVGRALGWRSLWE